MTFEYLCPQGHLLQDEASRAGELRKCPHCKTTFVLPEPKAAGPGKDARPEIVHILCPSGHELETPQAMLGKEAMCPMCRVLFRLRFADTVEYRNQKTQEAQFKQAKTAQAWMRWSIVAAVVVVVGLIGLILVATTR